MLSQIQQPTTTIYKNKNGVLQWCLSIVGVLIVLGFGVFYFIAPFLFLNGEETMFISAMVTGIPLVLFLVYGVLSYFIDMLKTGNQMYEYEINETGFRYKRFLNGKDTYDEGLIPFSHICRIVVSRKIIRVRENHIKHKYLIYPVIHLIYKDGQEFHPYLLKHTEFEINAMNQLLLRLQKLGLPLEYTDRQIDLVPGDAILSLFENELKTAPLDFKGDLLNIEAFSLGYSSESPNQETDDYWQKVIQQKKIMRISYPIWLLFIIQFIFTMTVFTLVEMGTIHFQSIWFLGVIPYIITMSSYILFLYRLSEIKYWKTLIHWGTLQAIYLVSYFLTIVFLGEQHVDSVFEAYSAVSAGIHVASIIPYFITFVIIRQEKPAIFHNETKVVMEKMNEGK
ncbi:hypothetical protein [Mesobacillus jeotgali]|uniref:hypothetical protein n=1 Tax=Mesobacillus jeotgali TaxID=129985 RepID=UPI0009A5C0C2|nr:hypothetical protein [Mesobacillus jeotgali]